jgi:hypothetical protein
VNAAPRFATILWLLFVLGLGRWEEVQFGDNTAGLAAAERVSASKQSSWKCIRTLAMPIGDADSDMVP